MADKKTSQWALHAGTVLEKGRFPYEVVEVLGQGGFGITYKVMADIMVGTIPVTTYFAVKEYFPSGCWRDKDGVTMLSSPAAKSEIEAGLEDFINEGERLQRICKLNRNIVNVNEVFRDNGTAYYVMEYLDGGDVRSMVKAAGAGVGEARMMSIIRPIAIAVQCLHDNMMLHLDIKPENIVMRRSRKGMPDEPVLIDFGIAVHFNAKGTPTTKNPTAGTSAGYSPIEQYSAIKVFDPRIDIYALSATCFYMLTGKDPIDALNMPAGFVRENLPDSLSELTASALVHGMSRDNGDRQRTVKKFLQDFEAQHTLQVGDVINGSCGDYMISSVEEEENGRIHYMAIPWLGARKNGSGTNDTSAIKFDVLEWWLPGFRRNGRQVDTMGTPLPNPWPLAQSVSGLTEVGMSVENDMGGTLAELVEQNGTLYCVVRNGWKPRRPLPRLLKPMLAAAGVIAMAFAGYYVARLLTSGSDKSQDTQVESAALVGSTAQEKILETKPESKKQPKPAPALSNRTFTVGGVSFTMVEVQGGTFTMGGTSEQGSDADDSEKPPHNVTLSSYYIGQTEVTQELWQAVMGENPSNFKGDKLPVETVSWKDCQKFIKKLNKITGKKFRLPTEAEWEFAARGGNLSKGYKYSGSDNIYDVAWFRENTHDKGPSSPDYGTHPVASKQPNELGLYDMSGNVCEWCQNKWYYDDGSSDPGSDRVVYRGGGWLLYAGFCQVSWRGVYWPDFRINFHGFRLAL